jgi:hypothetical protein
MTLVYHVRLMVVLNALLQLAVTPVTTIELNITTSAQLTAQMECSRKTTNVNSVLKNVLNVQTKIHATDVFQDT